MVSKLYPYLHGVFAILLYLIGNFFTIVILEYKLKNVNLKHTIAGFVCVALSGMVAYLVPISLLNVSSPMTMQIIGIISALVVQGVFWFFWFKKDLERFAPALVLAFTLSVLIAFLFYNIFVWYVTMVAKGITRGAVVQTVKDIIPIPF